MGLEDGDITALRHELTQELGQDDLVEEPDSARPPTPPTLVDGGRSDAPPRTPSDHMRRAREWVEECERELRDQPDVRRAARLYFEMARTCESPLKDTRRALQYYQAALERAPDYVPAIRATRRLLLGARMFPDALALFDAEARVTRQPRDKATLFLLKGRLLEDVLGNREDAEDAYQTARALDRTHAAILHATEQRAFANQSWEDVDRNLAELANAAASDDNHRAALLIRRAQLLESRQQRPEQAAELYETALQLDPNATIAVQALKRLYYGQRRWRDLIRTLEAEAKLALDPANQASSLYRAARIHAERLGNRDEAIRTLEQARRLRPDDSLILAELARHYEASQRLQALVETLEVLTEATDDDAERLTFTQRIARLYEEELRDVDQAIAWHERAVELHPTSLSSLQALSLLYRVRGAWPKLIEMCLREARYTRDAQRRADAHARAAEIFETRLNGIDEAVEHYHRALNAMPDHSTAFKALARLLSDVHRPKELVQLYENALDRATGTRAVSYLLKIAQIYEDVLAEHALAAQTYKRVLQQDSSHLAAVHAWQRSAARAQRPRELLEALDYEINLTVERDRLVGLLHRTGEVLDEQLDDRDEAIARYRRALEKDPRHIPTLSNLGRLYYAAGRWNDLLDVYGQELRLTSAKNRRVALLEKMAEISRDRLGSNEDALRYHREAVKVDPGHAPSLQELARQLRERGAWEELVDILELQLRNSSTSRVRARSAFLLGQAYEEHLDNLTKAVTSYEAAVSADSSYRPAVDALARVRAEEHDWTRLLSDIDRETKLTEDPGQRIALHARKAQVLERQDKHRQAIQAWEEVLSIDDRHLGALLALEQLYRQVGAWESLCKIHSTQAEVLQEPSARVAALYELARLLEHQGLGEREAIVDAYRRVLDAAPCDLGALLELERLAVDSQNLELLAEVDSFFAKSAQDPAVLAVHRARLGERAEGSAVSEAIEQFRAAATADPHHIGAARGLTRVAQETDDPNALVDALRREAASERDSKAASDLYVQSAVVRLERAGDHDGARGDFERALELWPDSERAAEGLIDVLTVDANWAALVDRLSQAASSAGSVDRASALWLEVSRIQSRDLGEVAGAIRTLQRVLKVEPRHLDALERLSLLFRSNESWHEAAATMEQLLAAAPESDQLQRVQLELAQLYRERLGMPEKAFRHVDSVLASDPAHAPALQELSLVHEQLGQVPEALQVTRHLLEINEGQADHAHTLVRLGQLENATGNAARAREALASAVELDGPRSKAAFQLEPLCTTIDDWRAYADALGRYEASDEPDRVTTVLEIARILSDHCGDEAAAIRALSSALEEGVSSPDLRRELAVRLRKRGDSTGAVGHLQEVLTVDPLREDIWRELALTYESQGRVQEARIASLPLRLFGVDDEEDRQRIASASGAPARARPKSLRGQVLDQLGTPRAEDEAAGALLAALSPALAKLYPPELESYGLATRDRLATEANHPLREIANRIAATLDVRGFDLFLHRVRNRGITVEFGAQPALLVPATIMEKSPGSQTFLLAQPLTQIARGYHAIEKLTPRELDVLLASAARTVKPDFGIGLTSEEFLDEQTRRLQRAIPRRDRRHVRETALAYAEARRVKFERWVKAARRTATRVALLLCDELEPLVQDLQSRIAPERGAEGTALHDHPAYREALSFWASAAAMHLREHMGLITRP
ncbi:MAG: tetratricopeptide repeat protein [Myxococcales bacterium]|nr:tetratricopeptide repeat protein [Myxococcales bacterium]MDH3485876.1 tetratricopeptide repeat protein [Myxococcales bacterium]